MEEVYAFDGRVAARWPKQIQIVPDDPQAFLDYLRRANLECDPYWHGEEIWVSAGSRPLVVRSEGAERVRYSVQARSTRAGRQMRGVAIEPLPAIASTE